MRRALTIAFALHALAIVGFVRIAPPHAPAQVATAPSASDEQALELVPIEDVDGRSSSPSDGPRGSGAAAPRLAMRGTVPRAPSRDPVTTMEVVETGRAPEDTAERVTPSLGRAPLSAEELGIAGSNRFLAMTATAEADAAREGTARAASERANAALRAPADARAIDLGLGPDGPVRTALTDATSEGLAPVKGRARFQVLANAHGLVVAVRLLDTNGGRDGWQDAAERAHRALAAGPRLRLPSTARGAEMTFEVTSASELPSGQAPGTQIHVLGRRVKKGEDETSTDVRFLEPPRVELVDVGQGIKLPVPVIGLGIVGTNGDPANVGASARRVVHTRLLSTRYL